MQEEFQADARQLKGQDAIIGKTAASSSPPKATLARRAQSYSDFHDAAKAVLGEGGSGKRKGGKKDRERPKDEARQKPNEENISSELEFVEWYHGLEQELLDSSHDEYSSYQKQLELSESHLDSLLRDTSSTLDLLASLNTSFKEVESQTTVFQKQCEGLLDEQKRIEGLAKSLESNLMYYNYLEPVTRRLNAPGAGSFVRSKEFSEMLARLDGCLEYMAAHVCAHFGFVRLMLIDRSRNIWKQLPTNLAIDC